MAIRGSLETQTEVTLLSAVSSIAFPSSSSDGVSIASEKQVLDSAGAWKQASAGHVDAAIFMESSAAQTLSGAVGLYGYRTTPGKWYLLGALNSSTAIPTLGSSTGWSCVIEFGGVFDRLAIGPLTSTPVTPSSGTVTFKACQIRQMTDRQ